MRVFLFALIIALLSACGGDGSSNKPDAPDNGNGGNTNDAVIQAVELDIAALNFDRDTMTYDVTVGNESSSVAFTLVVTTGATASTAAIINDEEHPLISGSNDPIALQVGDNAISLVAKNMDGEIIESYTINIYRAPSNEALLADLSLSLGELSQTFSSTKTAYTASVASGTVSIQLTPVASHAEAVVKINGQIAPQGEASFPVGLAFGINKIAIQVIAQDGKTKKNYTLNVTRRYNSDATLQTLTFSYGGISFIPTQTAYALNVPYSVANWSITPTLSDQNATLTINNVARTSGSAHQYSLSTGINTFNIKVTAQDGTTTQTYTVTVDRALNNDASLQNLSLSSGSLSFSDNATSYTVSVPYTVTTISLTPTLTDANASLTIESVVATSGSANGPYALVYGDNSFVIVTTSEDGSAHRTYTVTVTRLKNDDASLRALTASTGVFNFASDNTYYEYTVPTTTSTLSVTATPTDSNATFTVNSVAAVAGQASTTYPLAFGSNTISVRVTAHDGVTQKTYTLVVHRQLNDDATLSALTLLGGTIANFSPSGSLYALSVPATTASVRVCATLNDSNASFRITSSAGFSATGVSGTCSSAIALNFDNNTITIQVDSQDGEVTRHYYLNIERQFSNDATLASLDLSAGSINFSSSTTTYNIPVATNISTFSFTPALNDPNASFTINGAESTSGQSSPTYSLAFGANIYTIVVTAQDGTTTKTYTLTVNRAYSTNATLSGLVVSPQNISFNSNTTNYSLSTPYSTASVTVAATLADSNATFTIESNLGFSESGASGQTSSTIPLATGSNTITVSVTAQNGSTTTDYILTITRALNADATLQDLSLSTGSITFASNTTTYTLSVANTVATTTVTPTLTDANASVTVNGAPVASGNASAAITLTPGDNTITIVVTAENDVTTKIYTVTITRAYSSDASLSSLILTTSGGDQTLDETQTNQSITLDYDYDSITITPTTTQSTASITVNNIGVNSGNTSGSIALNVGSNNTITVKTTAPDLVTTNTYTITVTRRASSYLDDLSHSAGSLDQMFQNTSLTYTASVGYLVTRLAVTPTAQDSNATITVNGASVASGNASNAIALTEGDNTVTLVVTASDNSTKTYTLTITRDTLANFAQSVYGKASDTSAGDQYGYALTAYGDYLLVGAPFDDSAAGGVNGNEIDDCATTNSNCATDSGAVFVYKKASGVWSKVAYIKPTSPIAGSNFGWALDFDGSTLVVGATNDSAYAFNLNGATWSQQAVLIASNDSGGSDDHFGYAVSVSGDVIVIGAKQEDSAAVNVNNDENSDCGTTNNNCATDSGAAYVFRHSAGTWSQEAYLKAANTAAGDNFGQAVKVAGITIAIGSPNESTTAAASGAVYTYTDNSGWSYDATIKQSSPTAGARFGASLDMESIWLAIGAPDDDSGAPGSGAVYLFAYSSGAWSQHTVLTSPSPTASSDDFGVSLDLSGDRLAIGDNLEDSISLTDPSDDLLPDAGAAYLFINEANSWVMKKYLKAHNLDTQDFFGFAVTLTNDALIVGAPNEDSDETGLLNTTNGAGNVVGNSGAIYIVE